MAGPDYGTDEDAPIEFGDSVWGVPTSLLPAQITVARTDLNVPLLGAFPGMGIARSDVKGILQGFGNLSGPDLANLQLQLLLTGYDTRKVTDVIFGHPDPGSYTAFTKAVKAAARSGVALEDLLNEVEASDANIAALTASGGTRQVRRVSNPEDLRDAALKGFQEALGRGPTDAERAQFLGAFQSSELAAQPDNTVASGPGTAGAGPVDIVRKVATELGVDPQLAVAIMMQESGGNAQAVGDKGTSFGLFQLHRGGELGSLSPQQAFDPETNARVALSRVAAVARQHPDWSPGKIAAAAQRPKDRVGYAKSVDSLYGAPRQASPSSPPVSTPIDVTNPANPGTSAEAQARRQNPDLAQSHDMLGVYRTMLTAIGAQ